MKKVACIAGSVVAALAVLTVNAQTIAVKSPPPGVKIDGIADEWKGYQESVNDKSHISYIISSDKDNLYLVVKTKDRKKQQNILGAGITFSVDPQGKKKEVFSVTFPNPNMDDLSEFEHLDDANFKMRVAATEFMKIRANGFTGVTPILGSQKNDQNIYAAIKATPEGELVLEEVIPLKLFATTLPAAPEWSFNIKINGLFIRAFPSFGGGGGEAPAAAPSGGRGGGGRSARVSPAAMGGGGPAASSNNVNYLTSSSDFWGKFAFAQ